jgi:flagellar assembly protein FliH
MAIVKHTQAERLARSAVVLDLGDLKRQAADLLADARADAEAVIAAARAEAQARIDESDGRGYDDGFRRGLDEGRAAGRAEALDAARDEFRERFQALDERFSAAAADWERRRRALLLAAEEDVLAFAFALASRVVHRIVEQDPSVAVDQVRAALELLSRPGRIAIRVHPDDRTTIDAVLPVLRDQIPTCEHLTMGDDPSVGRGGCIVTTAGGEIDASIATQLDRIAASLLPGQTRLDAAPAGPAVSADRDAP